MVIHIIGSRIKRCIVIVLIVMIGKINMYSFGAGIFYPKREFSFKKINSNFYSGSANIAVDMADELTPEINVWFRQPGNCFKTRFDLTFLTTKNYSQIYIKEIKYIYENTEYIVLKNAKFYFSPKIREINSPEDGWITNGKYYWYNGWSAKPENWKDKSKLWPETNFEKIFKNKKVGDVFPFKVIIEYNFDDEAEKSITQDFIVTTLKGEYVSIFAGF